MTEPDKTKVLWESDEIEKREENVRNIRRIQLVMARPSGNLLRDHREMRDLLPWALNMIVKQGELINTQARKLRAAEENIDALNAGKSWSAVEDHHLVECRAKGESVASIAAALERSPASVATRLSQLVGIPRRALRIDGKRIEGQLEGLEVSGRFVGNVINVKESA